MKLTLAEARSGVDWASTVNLCSTDSRLTMLLNEAVRRLRPKGHWVGLTQRYRICTGASCITWPRQIETLEGVWVCSKPLVIRNSWYELLPNSYGLLSSESSLMNGAIDRGTGYCQFSDCSGAAKLAVFSSNPLDIGKQVLLQGRDSNNAYIRTVNDTVDGEYVTLTNGIMVSTSVFAPPGLVGVQKEVTTSPVRCWWVDPSCPSGVVADISAFSPVSCAYWEPDETLPSYRRTLLPSLEEVGQCSSSCSTTSSCATPQVTVAAKLQFIPVSKATDYLQIANLPALTEMVISILKARRSQWDEAEAAEARAVRLLEEELSSHMGHGVVQPFKVEQGWGAGDIENFVSPWDYPYSR